MQYACKIEVFIVIVDIINTNIGRVIDDLQETRELDNTFILFMSDNRVEEVALEALPVRIRSYLQTPLYECYLDKG